MESKFSLALGGGAARGLAHIGAIRAFEESGFRPSAVAGTSMGAIVAALLAFGKTSSEMVGIAASVPYFKLLDSDLRSGLIGGKKIEKYLRTLFGDAKIEDAKIPLAIVATDILTGGKRVFREGDAVSAIRASIGIPGVLKPFEYDGTQYVDGGISENLPVEELPDGPVLAVSVLRDVGRPIKTRAKVLGFEWNHAIFGMGYQILQKTIDIMMAQNEARSLASRPGVTLLHPRFEGIDYYEFHRHAEIVRIGYETAKAAAETLRFPK